MCNCKHPPQAPPLLRPITTSKPYEIVGIDALKLGLTRAGNRYLLVVIDHFTKWCSAYPIPDKKADTIVKVFADEWCAREGRTLLALISDRGAEFVNGKIMTAISEGLGMTQTFTAGYNLRANGLTERMNRTLIAMLAKSTPVPMDWDRRVPYVLFAYNATPHSTTGESPFYLLHGFDPDFPLEMGKGREVSVYEVDMDDCKTELLAGLKLAREIACNTASKSQQGNKILYDRRNRTSSDVFKTDDRVYVYMPNEQRKRANPKLHWNYTGPYRVLAVPGHSATVKLILGKGETFSVPVDQLKKVPKEVSDVPYLGATQRRRLAKNAL
ncbi:unnamed protein product [Gongylonema pulchrum]|uniref:Integrase catalytic domain-containing protein n=1 Tax=Gongylonema pulchrum TaxID=637853 RepID=A0A183DU64_9BILA|nr:unnamed protein product [Gongylonema pulchrum]